MDLIGIYNLYRNTELRARTAAAIADAAQDVLNEADATPNHVNRLVWARDALTNAEPVAKRMFWGLLGNSTIQDSGEASTDNDIKYVVAGLINTFAGE